MMAHRYMAYRIPCDEELPVERIDVEDSYMGVTEAVFGDSTVEHGERVCGVSTFGRAGVQMVYDDMGLFRAGPRRNDRAMHTWAYLTGMRLDEFATPLVGDFIVLGMEDGTGDTADVPVDIAVWIEERFK